MLLIVNKFIKKSTNGFFYILKCITGIFFYLHKGCTCNITNIKVLINFVHPVMLHDKLVSDVFMVVCRCVCTQRMPESLQLWVLT